MESTKVLSALFLMASTVDVLSFAPLPKEYQVVFGRSEAKVKVTEYFSFSCPKCVGFISDEFPQIQKKYIETGLVEWTFHPDPADIVTIQAMICLEYLKENERQQFIKDISRLLSRGQMEPFSAYVEMSMEPYGITLSNLKSLTYLKQSEAFKAAFAYVKQEDSVAIVPTIAVDGKIYDDYPTLKFIEEKLAEAISEKNEKT